MNAEGRPARPPALRGIGLVPGLAGGEAWVGPLGVKRPLAGDRVLVCDSLPNWVVDLRLPAVVCERPIPPVAPGLDTLRRRGVPVVGGVAGALRVIRSGQTVVVDGTLGRVWANAVVVPADLAAK